MEGDWGGKREDEGIRVRKMPVVKREGGGFRLLLRVRVSARIFVVGWNTLCVTRRFALTLKEDFRLCNKGEVDTVVGEDIEGESSHIYYHVRY